MYINSVTGIFRCHHSYSLSIQFEQVDSVMNWNYFQEWIYPLKSWDEIAAPLPAFWEWKINLVLHFTEHLIIQFGIIVHPC